MRTDFRRIAIVNRAEPVLRLIRAVREFNQERGTSIETVALYAPPDRGALYVREADAAVDLGDGPMVEDERGHRHVVYLDLARVERGLVEAQADAVWAGWGFVSERPDFVELCDRLGLVFIGPSAAAMRAVGDKVILKHLALQLGVPVVPWGRGPADTLARARADAQSLGYPVVVKATMGAGGRGIRRVDNDGQLAGAFEQVRDEASRLFENPQVFVERWLAGSRHVEVQVAADSHGTAWAIGTRDCSIQRRYQKLIEEAPAAGLTPDLDAALRNDALKVCRASGYDSVGSVEFLVSVGSGRHYLLEMNPRQQVEHAVTEMTSGVDLVKLQLHLSLGGRLEGQPPPTVGVAVGVRLNAEDAERGFAPAPGRLTTMRVAPRPGLRLDAGLGEGDVLPPEYDSMFAKLVAVGRSRFEALETLSGALAETSVVIEGGVTNRALLLHLLRHPDVRTGATDVDWLDRLAVRSGHVSRQFGDVALVQAAVEACDGAIDAERDEFFATAARQRPVVRDGIGRTFEMRYRGHTYSLEVLRQGQQHYRVIVEGRRVDVVVGRAGATERLLTYAGRRYRTQSIVQGLTHVVEIGHTLHRISRDEAGIVHAFSPAVVVAVHVKPGAHVEAGDPLVVLESMKMETAITASAPGTVRDVWVLANSQVSTGTRLVRIDLDASVDEASRGPRVGFAGVSFATPPASTWRARARAVVAGLRAFAEALAPPDVEHARDLLAELRELMLGSDIAAADVSRAVDEYRALADRLPPDDPVVLRLEDEILRIFADVSALFGRQGSDEDPNEAVSLSAGQYLLTYLRTLDARGTGLPASFVSKLKAALTHFGSDSLEVTPALRSRLFWLYRAHLHAAEQATVAQAVLDRRLRRAAELDTVASPDFADLLQQLVTVAGDIAPALGDLARDVHYRYFVQPVFERGRQAAYDEVEDHLAQLARAPQAPDRAARIAALVDCPHPLGQFLALQFEGAGPALRDAVLEVLTRRYYRVGPLKDLHIDRLGDRSLLSAAYELGGRTERLFATHATVEQLDTVLAGLATPLSVAQDDDLLLDLYLAGASEVSDPDRMSRTLAGALTAAPFPRPLRRIVVAGGGTSADWSGSATPWFTFLWNGDGYAEETIYRGLHPMMGKRLEIWRLSRFHLARLPSVEDVYLFHAVAHENPRDERLFALLEVRDLSTVRDSSGDVVEVPQVERLLMEAGNAIRQFQLKRGPDERLLWNRISMKVVPPLTLTRNELLGIAKRLGLHTEGLGLEKVVIVGPMVDPVTGHSRELALTITNPGTRGVVVKTTVPHGRPLAPLADYESKVVRMRQRGLAYPYEVVRLLAPERSDVEADLPHGDFTEHDLDADGRLVPVSRPWGQNTANVVFGVVRNFTAKYPEGMARVIVLGDPSREMGSLAEGECRRIDAAIDLAETMQVPLEWFALSAGARISMQSGTENMDWIARVLRRIVLATQRGQEINIVVTGINVGAQPYWNAEATMLMHTKGILVMMPESAMVLTGKTALDYSGSVSAEDNLGIGGYDVMGPNGQAQYWAKDLHEACSILLRHYDHAYVLPGERGPRRAKTTDPVDRDVRAFPHGRVDVADFATIGDAFSSETNPGRKRPFDIRRVMLAVSDQDHEPLERWTGLLDGEISVVWDAHIGGYPVCLLGFESRPVRRLGFVPTDGPDQWTSGTLFPMASRKTARAINAASGNRPLVVLANLSGFDGSPESMRRRQLEVGAEIGRAVVNFKGPIVFCVVSRYHGGAFVVFSKTLNDNMEVAALEGTYASVIGGAPAAAGVFSSGVENRTRKDPRIAVLEREIATADATGKRRVRAQMGTLHQAVRSEKLGEVAEEFDAFHSVHRALDVGSLDRIIPPGELRPYLVDAIERGLAKS